MILEQYYLGCLSQASYLIGDETTGRAVVVDPQRDVGQYLTDAEANDLRIERVIETHYHADFVSGHQELAGRTGAVISYGEGADADFPIEPLRHKQRLSLGVVELEIRATPGHTPGSISVLDEAGGILVAGDALGTSGGAVQGSNPRFTDDMDAANASVVKLGTFEYETLLVGHGDPIVSGASDIVAAYQPG